MNRFGMILVIFLAAAALFFFQWRYRALDFFLPVSGEKYERMHKEAVEKLRQEMMDGKTDIEINYMGKADGLSDFASLVMDEAFMIDSLDTSDDFDYLHYKFVSADIRMQGMGNKFTIKYTINYLETKEQTVQVNQKIKEVFEELGIENKSELKKIRLIHDYIISNSEYDLSSRYNSAYGCLIMNQSACQGYAQLAYKMFTEAGIPCRIVTGKSGGSPHAWNIVKLDGKWYFIDCTWDDPVGTDIPESARYDYFLKGKMNFQDHILDEEFTTDEFQWEYPVEYTDYGR